MITELDKKFLQRAVDLAKKSLDNGDEPFGSVLVSEQGDILFEGPNEVASGDNTKHPEFAIAKWAAQNLSLEDRKKTTVYTSGEHCPMCSAAHGWVGLGKIIYAASSAQLKSWLEEFGAKLPRVKTLPIQDIITDTIIIGPIEEFSEILKSYHKENFLKKQTGN